MYLAEESPSVWREWIEIKFSRENRFRSLSPSVWREWIEMFQGHELDKEHLVSLRVEGVD